MDFSYSTAELGFREEVRAWIKKNVPGDFGSESWPAPNDEDAYRKTCFDWMKKLQGGGWVGIDWPKEYGGRSASPIEGFIWLEEISKYVTPPSFNGIGVGMAGPTIMAHGTPDQKQRYLKNILSGEEIWCQGFSEPNAGSDLANLKTSSVMDGDHYIVNGQKIWTSVAHLADYCILVTRSDSTGSKHQGMTYMIVDMHAPGVEIRPLRQITGDAEFNEVFFNEVKVPKENVLGSEGHGWMVAITTLMHERVNIAGSLYGRIKKTLHDVVALTKRIQRNGGPLCEDPIVRQKLAKFHCKVETQRLNNLRMRATMDATRDPGPIGSIFKLLWAEANKDLTELAVDILGPFAEVLPNSDAHNDDIGIWTRHFLRARANSIEGGTTEILKNITAERVLGLPR